MRKTTGMLAVVVLALAGCGEPAAEAPAAADGDDPAAHRELLDAVEQPLERARSVEGIEAGHKRAMDEAIDAQTR